MVAVSPAAPKTAARAAAEEALLDAAERLLADAGYAGVTTRRLAEEAGINHGLVHYYFGSNENLTVEHVVVAGLTGPDDAAGDPFRDADRSGVDGE